jgi:NADH:ubiquinone oxidoreductase subunit C
MTSEEFKVKITTLLPAATFEEGGEFLNVVVPSADWLPFAKQLRTDAELQFNFLFCLSCVDFKTNLTMVYHFRSTTLRHELVIRSVLDRNDPEIQSVSRIWRTADFHEREAYEMFGVKFIDHPDLRLLILPDGWEGKNPMRKDYEDEINMIKL